MLEEYESMEDGEKKVEGPVYNWRCVTEEFMTACSKLDLGELLHDSSFGLFEAMSAIEMMDVKMDAGMMCNQIKRKVLTLPQAIEVTWLEGHSLAQTVFTNLYLHDPSLIEDRTMRAFSVCMLKIVDLIRDRINRSGVYEEEDFQPLTYGFKMAGDVTDVKAVTAMKEVEDELSRAARHLKGLIQEGSSEETSECEGVPQAKKLINQMLELIKTIKETVSLGIHPEDREVTKNDYPTIMGFDPLINQRLLPPTFPRYTVIHDRGEALDYIHTLLERLLSSTAMLDATNIQEVMCSENLVSYHHVFLAGLFCSLHSCPQVGECLVSIPSQTSSRTPSEPLTALYNNAEVKQYVDALVTRAVRPVCTVLQVLGHNRARQRDKWAHLLDEMVSLQDEADKVDGYLHQIQMKMDPNRQYGSSFGTWVLYYTLQVMLAYTLSGFELELYAPYEYHYVYWYLYELLYSWLYSTIQRAETFVIDHEAFIESVSVKGRGSKKGKKKKRSKAVQRELIICQAQQNMFGGYYKKLKQPSFEYDREEVRYSHRLAPFACVSTPPMVPYSQYKTQTVIRVAKTNFVTLKLLSGGHKQDSEDPPEFDFSLHKLYPVIKV
ncbi:NAA35-like protein [Mya arenaria]|uniref:Protein MAK10 homolog n=1 Tax=Mya arenaria TaxID=6604 RepID=A0ABY7DWE5_MYAAR|nr:NAA35-like protein [Mya arenaria]